MSRDYGRLARRELPFDHMQIGAADAASLNSHKHFPRPGSRIGDIDKRKRVRLGGSRRTQHASLHVWLTLWLVTLAVHLNRGPAHRLWMRYPVTLVHAGPFYGLFSAAFGAFGEQGSYNVAFIPGRSTMAKRFKDLTEREILALGIQLEEEDSRVYGDFAEGLRETYPATAKVFEEMQAEESRHRQALIDMHRKRFGEHIPLIRRQDVKGFIER